MNHDNLFRINQGRFHGLAFMVGAAACAAGASGTGPRAAADSSEPAPLRFVEGPALERSVSTGDILWRASVGCDASVPGSLLVGARVALASDLDLDRVADAVDTVAVAPADCDDAGRIPLRRRLSPAPAALRASLLTPGGSVVASHELLTAGAGSLLRLTRYCAAPQNGEPEWIEVRNVASRALAMTFAKLEGRALAAAGFLEPGAAFVAGSDTAELRLWQPGARLVALSSWSNLRNSGDTLRLTREDGFVLDTLVHSPAASTDGCASLATEGAAAAASGYALEFSARRWARSSGDAGAAAFTITVRAPAEARYDLVVYDLDGRPLCTLARAASGPASFSLPASCPALGAARAGRVIIHLSPHAAPGVRALLRIAP